MIFSTFLPLASLSTGDGPTLRILPSEGKVQYSRNSLNWWEPIRHPDFSPVAALVALVMGLLFYGDFYVKTKHTNVNIGPLVAPSVLKATGQLA